MRKQYRLAQPWQYINLGIIKIKTVSFKTKRYLSTKENNLENGAKITLRCKSGTIAYTKDHRSVFLKP